MQKFQQKSFDQVVIANDICQYASYGCDQRLVELYCKNSGRTMDCGYDVYFLKECDIIERRNDHIRDHGEDD